MVWYIEGQKLGIYPTPNETKEIRIHYVQVPTSLSANGDTMSSALEDYEDGVVYFVCWKKAEKQALYDKKFEPLAAYYYKQWLAELKTCQREGGIQELGVESVTADPDSYA